MKKGGYLFAFVLSLIALMVFASSFTSAYYLPSVRSVSQNVIDTYINFFEPILQSLFGGYGGWSGYLLFERFLLFIVLVSVVSVIMGRVPLFENQKMVRWVISIAVPLIGMRYINYSSLEAIITQYQVLAIVITAVIPFIIFFYFVHSIGGGDVLRRALWVLFILVYAGLWSTTTNELGSTIYFWTIVAAVACIIFDKIIDSYIKNSRLAESNRGMLHQQLAEISKSMREYQGYILNGDMSANDANKRIRELDNQRKEIMKHL